VPRSEVLRIRLTPDELERWQRYAARRRLSVSEMVRREVRDGLQAQAIWDQDRERELEAERRRREAAAKLAEAEGYRLP
jgi:hypothetical protein